MLISSSSDNRKHLSFEISFIKAVILLKIVVQKTRQTEFRAKTEKCDCSEPINILLIMSWLRVLFHLQMDNMPQSLTAVLVR